MNIQHQLFPRDYQRRVDFCNWFRARPARFHDRHLLILAMKLLLRWMGKSILRMCDHTRLEINSLRTLISNGIAIRERSPFGQVSSRLSNCRTIFFEGNVNGNSYLAMLNEFVVPNIRDQLGVGNNGRFTRVKNSD